MPQIINTNLSSLTAQRNLDRTQAAGLTALNRLSSGLRINSCLYFSLSFLDDFLVFAFFGKTNVFSTYLTISTFIFFSLFATLKWNWNGKRWRNSVQLHQTESRKMSSTNRLKIKVFLFFPEVHFHITKKTKTTFVSTCEQKNVYISNLFSPLMKPSTFFTL